MKLPNSYGSVTKRRRPYIVRKTVGFHIDEKSQKVKQEFAIIGYARTKKEGLQMLADYNKNPFDLTKAKITFEEVYEKWSKQKFKTISNSNVNAYKASYKCCKSLYNRLKICDFQICRALLTIVVKIIQRSENSKCCLGNFMNML
jgi:hypothetical protein